MTLKQFRYFEALAQHRHFKHAAEACAISQPALSMQIKELEQSLGADLFERVPKKLRLTRFGEEFALRVRDILQSVDALEDLSRTAQGGLAGRLRIGVIPTIAPYLLPSLISDLTRAHEGVDIHVRETLTKTLVQELEDGLIDTAIVALPISEPSLTEISLFEEPFVLIRQNADQGMAVPDAHDLRDMRLLLLEEGHCFRDQALSFCNIGTRIPRDGLDGSSLSTLVQMVGSGIGLTIIPQMAVPVETSSAPVCVSQFDGTKPMRTIGMIWRKTSPMADQLIQVSEIVRAAGLRLTQAV